MINSTSDNIKVEGHKGTWYVIDSATYEGETVYLLEHETYGDMAGGLIVDKNKNILLDDVWNGFDDYEYFIGA